VDWQIEDRYQYLPPGSDVHLRYTDLTANAQAFTAEAWIAVGGFGANPEVWIPCVMVRRKAQEGPLASTFVGVLEPYEGQSNLARIRRLPLQTLEGVAYPEANVAVEVQFPDGSGDLFVAADVETPLSLTPSITDVGNGRRAVPLVQPDWDVRLEGELGWIRRDAAGEVRHLALGRGNSVTVGDVSLRLKRSVDFIEVSLVEGRATVVPGPPEDVEDVLVKGRSVWQER
jgi:hypothetical protein